MFSDPQFWVAVSFFLFIAAIFNPVRKMLASNLDAQINEIKLKIKESEDLKSEAEKTLKELKTRESEVEKEINNLIKNSESKINQLKEQSSIKLSEQIDKRKILAENKINQILRDTNLYVKNYICNVAIDTTSMLLKNNLSDKAKSHLIDESINDLSKILKN